MFLGLWAEGRPALGCSGVFRRGFAGRFGSLQLNRGRVDPVESEVGLGEVEVPAPGRPRPTDERAVQHQGPLRP